MDSVLRVVLFAVIGGALLFANVVYFRAVYNATTERSVIIAPLQVVDAEGKTPAYGAALSAMLQARVDSITSDLDASQRLLIAGAKAGPSGTADVNAAALFSSGAVSIPTRLVDPVSINVSVAGVDVGGLLPWVQRRFTQPDTLSFHVFIDKDRAIVSGDIHALTRTKDRTLRIETGTSPGQIVDRLAYAIVQKRIASDPKNAMRERIAALNLPEFIAFVETTTRAAQLKFEKQRGTPVAPALYAELYAAIEQLVHRLPTWHQLTYFGAELADLGGRQADALKLYERVHAAPASKDLVAVLRTQSATRIQELRPLVAPSVEDKGKRFLADMQRHAASYGVQLPPVAITTTGQQGVQAFWNTDTRQYEIDPASLDQLSAHEIALMSVFLGTHHDACFGGNRANPPSIEIWNGFRHDVIRYLVTTHPTEPIPDPFPWYEGGMIRKVLSALDMSAGREPTRRFALALFNGFGCDWSEKNLRAKFREVNNAGNFVPAEALTRALGGR